MAPPGRRVCPDDMQADVDVRLLGPLEVRVAGSAVEFVGAKQRTLFSALALRAPEPVPVDDLIEALWAATRRRRHPGPPEADLPPARAAGRRRPAHAPSRGLRAGDRAGSDRRPALRGPPPRRPVRPRRRRARSRTDRSRRGPLPVAGSSTGRAPLRRFRPARDLAAGRAAARGDRGADGGGARCGRDVDLAGELHALVSEHPLRERLRAQLMLALYRGGRQAEAGGRGSVLLGLWGWWSLRQSVHISRGGRSPGRFRLRRL